MKGGGLEGKILFDTLVIIILCCLFNGSMSPLNFQKFQMDEYCFYCLLGACYSSDIAYVVYVFFFLGAIPALVKSIGLRTDGRMDDRSYWVSHVASLSTLLAIPLVYPRMMAIHNLDSEVRIFFSFHFLFGFSCITC